MFAVEMVYSILAIRNRKNILEKKKKDYICAMTNKDFNHRCGTVFGLAMLFVLLVGLMLIGFDVLRSFLFEPYLDSIPQFYGTLFDFLNNALKGN